MRSLRPIVPLLLLACLSGGCATSRGLYYDAWEKLGYNKRERLADDVKAARDEQANAKKQFTSALEQFKSVVNFNGGDLEAMYNTLNSQYQKCESEAGDVKSRIQTVKNVGQALFDEWKGEIAQIKDDPSLTQKSQQLYDHTHQSYAEMVSRMDTAAGSMDPVLTKFKNKVLFIKSNLNAQAIASLKGEELKVGADVDNLIKEMEASIAQADAFIAQIQPPKK
jgi:Protein of unknown function (DUF2959)